MSSKKNNFTSKDRQYMRFAINLAKDRIGLTKTNPSVGCVIVKNDQMISLGQTSLNGRPHAEYNSIKNCKEDLKDAIIYISLEPCSHYGKTPPCTNAIIKSNIKKVYFAVNDIDQRSSKKSEKILRSKKKIVKKSLLRNEAKNIYKSYFYTKKNKLPYVLGKIACSKDNYIFAKGKIITNEHSRQVTHLLRYKNQGILISSKTLNSDNSKLTCRISGLEKYSPTRFILDKNLETKKNSFIVKSAKKIKTYIFFNKAKENKKKYFIKSGITLINLKLNENNQFNLKSVLRKINDIGIGSLLVEGGKKLTISFLKAKLFNKFYLFKSCVKLGKKGKYNISVILKKLPTTFNFQKKIDTYLEKDQLIYYY